jgi:type I restriction enzyme, S subunit
MSAHAKQSLAAVLTRVQDSVAIDPRETYKQVTVRLFHKGVVLRGEKLGSAIQTARQWQVHQGQVLLSRIDARNGAIGIVPAELNGAVVTNDFWAFEINSARAIPAFLDAYFGTAEFVDACKTASEGTTNRVRLQPDRFLKVEVPLPSLDEQRRIVVRITDLAVKIKEGQTLRRESLEASSSVVTSLHISLSGQRTRSFRDILTLDERRVPIRSDGTYPQIGIKGFGGGLFARGVLGGTETTYREFNLLFDGGLVLSQVKGWEGAIAVCKERFAGWYASPEYRTFSFIPEEALPEYMSAVVSSPWFYTKLADLTRGVGARRERTRPEAFLEMKIPMPTVEQQCSALQVFGKLDSLRKMQSETSVELDALMPSILSKAFRGEL